MDPRRLLPIAITLLCVAMPAVAWGVEDPTYVTGLQDPQWYSTDSLMRTDGPTQLHVMAGNFGGPVRGWWTYTLEPRSFEHATWAEVDGQMRICTEAGGPTPNIDVAFFLDNTSNLATTVGQNAFKSPTPGTCVDHGFNYPIQPAYGSLHISFELIRYEGQGPTVWVEWRNVVVRAHDLADPFVRVGSTSFLAAKADDLGRSSITIPAQPVDLESGVRALEGSIDGGPWGSVPADPTFHLTGFGTHGIRLRAVDNAGRISEPVAYAVRSYGRPISTAPPVLAGRPRARDVLDAGNGGWDGRGSNVDAFAYQWLRDGAPIEGATRATYALADIDVGTRLSASVTAHNEGGWSEAARSAATPPADGVPATAGSPTIIGRPTVGSRLDAGNGAWTGSGHVGFGYQWERCRAVGASPCAAISGAVGQAYVVGDADLGSALRIRVSGENAWGRDVALSEPTGVVVQPTEPVSPLDEADRPRLRGTTRVGSTTTVDVGTFSGTRPFSYSFRWLRCNSFGESCEAIKGAKAQSYRPTTGDAGRTLRADVTAANGSGSATSRTRASSLATSAGSAAAGSAPASQVQVILTTPFTPGKVGDGSVAWQLASSRLDLTARATRYRVRAGQSLVVSGRFTGDLGVRPVSVRASAVPIVAGAGRFQRTAIARVGRTGHFSVRLVPLVNSTIVVDTPSTTRIQGATLAIGRAGVIPRIRLKVTARRAAGLLSAPRAVGRVRPRIAGVQFIWQARAGAVQRLVCAPSEQPRSGRRGTIDARCSGIGIDPAVEFRLAFVPSGAGAALFLASASNWTRAVAR